MKYDSYLKKPTRCTIFQVYFDKGLYTFRTDLLSGQDGTSILTSLADSQHNLYDKYLLLCIQC